MFLKRRLFLIAIISGFTTRQSYLTLSVSNNNPRFPYVHLMIFFILTIGLSVGDFMVKKTSKKLFQENSLTGSFEIRQIVNLYHISGQINGKPTVFLVDTGSSYLTISTDLAKAAGIEDCSSKSRPIDTAGGTRTGCHTKVDWLEFGPFKFRQVKVMVIDGLPKYSLLGMNILDCFKIEQQKGVMKFTKALSHCPRISATTKSSIESD